MLTKYGKRISTKPASASRRSSIVAVIRRSPATDIGSWFAWSTSRKRDMCVPFTSAASATYMSIEATVACGPAAASTVSGWVMSFTPTRWIARLRPSATDWMSGRKIFSGAFIGRLQ